ncbi:MAG: hypothetical protein IJH98_03220, partial [Solobacterium sp.]|nr:hypothetical protein [Solobacterium sp.]
MKIKELSAGILAGDWTRVQLVETALKRIFTGMLFWMRNLKFVLFQAISSFSIWQKISVPTW